MASILPQLSDKGTTRHQVELEMINFITRLLNLDYGNRYYVPGYFVF